MKTTHRHPHVHRYAHPGIGRAGLLAAGLMLLAGPLAHAGTDTKNPQQVTCSLSSMLEDLRAALKRGSPALKKYMRELFKEAAVGLPLEELKLAFDSERDPETLETLGNALAARASRNSDPAGLKPILARIGRESNPSLRAAMVRGLRGIGSVEYLNKLGDLSYQQLMRDPSPEVRQAVAENLINESAKIYFGHDKAVSEAAVAAAAASSDPAVAAKLLREISMEQVSHSTVQQVTQQLHASSPDVRAAAAKALGGVPGAEAAGARNSLVDLYRSDSSPEVRRATLEAIAHLGLGQAAPILESLRSVDPALGSEIDAWQSALKLNLQEWYLVEREKQRLTK